MSRYVHIFFDLDNTLWDFDANSKVTLNELFDTYLSDKIDGTFNAFYAVYKEINSEYWQKYRHGKVVKEDLRVNRFHDSLRHFEIDDKNLAAKIASEYLTICPYKTEMMPHCFEILDYLKTKKYRLGVITNGFDEVQHIKMKNCGLNPYFEVLVTSEKLGSKKPYPDIFNHAFSLMQAKAENSIMIGDNHDSDIVGAANVGMDSVFLKLDEMPENFQGRYVIEDLDELRKIL